jgi:hypothetical protein
MKINVAKALWWRILQLFSNVSRNEFVKKLIMQ